MPREVFQVSPASCGDRIVIIRSSVVIAGLLLTLPHFGGGAAAVATTLTAILTFLIVGPHYRGGAGLPRFAAHLLVVVLLGLVINPGLSLLVQGPDAARTFMATAAVISFVNLHHFLLDGRIWRLRERRVVQSMIA
jgi:hypothetical protein